MLVWVSLYEFDKFKFKTWKTIEPGKLHVGVSESFWIWRIQNQYLKKVNLWISQQFILWPNNHIMHLFHESLHIFINTWKKSTCEYLSNSYYDQIIISTTTNAPAVMSTSTPMFWQRNCPMLTLWYASRHLLGLVTLRKSWIMHLFHESLHIFINCHQIGQVSLKLSYYI